MNGVVHVDGNFVNQKYTPLYPDRTLDKKIEKLCSKIDNLVNRVERVEATPPSPPKKKWPFWYLIVGFGILYYFYFKICSLFKTNVTTFTQPIVGNRTSYA